MRYLRTLCVIFAVFNPVFAAPAPEQELPEYIQSHRIADDDLKKKKTGFFFTGLPDISSDPITGFGFGARSNLYWNGDRENPLFPYAPYLARLKANAAYYTNEARELSLSLDLPYYNASRWRHKVDFKAQQNPGNLFYGLTQQTLGNPSPPPPGISTFNRFKETEYMLNLKTDYALGDGRWRIMGGYEIQHVTYNTFGDATASLLAQEAARSTIFGASGGWISLLQSALIYDTRDFEPDPTRGVYFELANEFSNPAIGSDFSFNKVFTQFRIYQRLPFGSRTVLAGRFGTGNIFGENAPFFEYQDQWSPEGSINALGGRQSLRGYKPNRFLARAMWFANLELRFRFVEFAVAEQHFALAFAPFFDLGTVRDNWQALNLRQLQFSYGIGLRIAWNQSTMISLDFGRSIEEDVLVFFGLGQIF